MTRGPGSGVLVADGPAVSTTVIAVDPRPVRASAVPPPCHAGLPLVWGLLGLQLLAMLVFSIDPVQPLRVGERLRQLLTGLVGHRPRQSRSLQHRLQHRRSGGTTPNSSCGRWPFWSTSTRPSGHLALDPGRGGGGRRAGRLHLDPRASSSQRRGPAIRPRQVMPGPRCRRGARRQPVGLRDDRPTTSISNRSPCCSAFWSATTSGAAGPDASGGGSPLALLSHALAGTYLVGIGLSGSLAGRTTRRLGKRGRGGRGDLVPGVRCHRCGRSERRIRPVVLRLSGGTPPRAGGPGAVVVGALGHPGAVVHVAASHRTVVRRIPRRRRGRRHALAVGLGMAVVVLVPNILDASGLFIRFGRPSSRGRPCPSSSSARSWCWCVCSGRSRGPSGGQRALSPSGRVSWRCSSSLALPTVPRAWLYVDPTGGRGIGPGRGHDPSECRGHRLLARGRPVCTTGFRLRLHATGPDVPRRSEAGRLRSGTAEKPSMRRSPPRFSLRPPTSSTTGSVLPTSVRVRRPRLRLVTAARDHPHHPALSRRGPSGAGTELKCVLFSALRDRTALPVR